MTPSVKRVLMDREVRSFHDLPSGGANMSPWQQFATAVVLFYRNYFRLRGRATRREFWWAALFHALISVVFMVISFVVTGGEVVDISRDALPLVLGDSVTLASLMSTWHTLNIIPWITLLARRFHDTDSSAALLFTLLIPVAGLVIVIIYALTASNPRGVRYDPPNATAARTPT